MTDALELLKEKIDAEGTHTDFAKAVGIGRAYLSQILSGKRPLARLPAETLLRFSKVSGIPMEQLASGSDNAAGEAPSLAPREADE